MGPFWHQGVISMRLMLHADQTSSQTRPDRQVIPGFEGLGKAWWHPSSLHETVHLHILHFTLNDLPIRPSLRHRVSLAKEVGAHRQLPPGRLQLHRLLGVLLGVLPERMRGPGEPI